MPACTLLINIFCWHKRPPQTGCHNYRCLCEAVRKSLQDVFATHRDWSVDEKFGQTHSQDSCWTDLSHGVAPGITYDHIGPLRPNRPAAHISAVALMLGWSECSCPAKPYWQVINPIPERRYLIRRLKEPPEHIQRSAAMCMWLIHASGLFSMTVQHSSNDGTCTLTR